LADEFDSMQDRATTRRAEYLKIERTGRGVGLTAAQRERVYAIYERYRASLAETGAEDWSGLALRFWRGLTNGHIASRLYDFIYIDEAQFFAPVWLRTLQLALKPGIGRLLLAADPTQGFLKRRQSWVACGLDLRGRSTRLRKSYRNTRPILEFAANFYRSRLGAEDEGDLNVPDEMELNSAEAGEPPIVLPLTSRQDEVTRVSNEINDFLQQGGNPEAILVLIGTGTRISEVIEHLSARFGTERVADARQTSGRGKLRVCSIDAATGLEAPIVFLIGGSELIEREDDLQMPADQRAELRRDNTRRLYMGFTRAGMRLVVTWVGSLPQFFAA
jgi:superfamily I DNA/RNA helicase